MVRTTLLSKRCWKVDRDEKDGNAGEDNDDVKGMEEMKIICGGNII